MSDASLDLASRVLVSLQIWLVPARFRLRRLSVPSEAAEESQLRAQKPLHYRLSINFPYYLLSIIHTFLTQLI